ncbi:hypothetical protein B0J11DRAFT_73474 [Dendryphion nanum]|uniref:NmrA-like domain-containing protein n=1 Tax=Dendryphion nanum TaxID=256645 RepID=A0A9P9DIX9_9PLEO|nr:hypothetical protein B0J11DRAFT_73474 [Dendryphion nanum]
MSSSVVAVAGGTGNLGRAIVEALVASKKFQVFILGREANEAKSAEIGAKILATDYSSVESVTKVLEDNKIDTVISTLGSFAGPDPEHTLIKASDASSVTKRYIPSTWGISYTPETISIFKLGAAKLSFFSLLASTSLQHTSVVTGYFLDYWCIPKVPSYLRPVTLVIDIPNRTAAIPGSGNVPVVFTHSFDIAKFIPRLLAEKEWEAESFIVGDRLTLNEFLALAEEVTGEKFSTTHDSVEKLEQGQLTELPGHKEMYAAFPKEMLQGLLAAFGLLFEKGQFEFKGARTLNEKFGDVKVRGVKEVLEKAWGRE